MNFIPNFLVNLGLIKPSLNTINRWNVNNQTSLLVLSIKSDIDFKLKLKIVELLQYKDLSKYEAQFSKVLAADNIPKKELIDLLIMKRKQFSSESYSKLKRYISEAIHSLDKEHNYDMYLKKYKPNTDDLILIDKSKMKRLENVRQLLKKPIR